MTPGVVDINVPTKYTAEIRGKAAIRVLKKAGVPRMYEYRPLTGGKPCWIFPAERVGDVLAAAEVTRGVRAVLHHEQEALL
jgi:Fe-S oxidoreductase